MDCWFDTWHRTFSPTRHPQPRDAWRRRFLSDYAQQAEVWVAAGSRGLAGFLVLFPEAESPGGWIEQLFVHPDFHGQGYGRALLSLAGLRCPGGLALDTPISNQPARDFYRRRGFEASQIGFDPTHQWLTLRYACPGRRREA